MKNSLERTPTWAVSIVCLCFILLSLVIDMALNKLTGLIRKRKRKSLTRALEKLKTEMMTMGFISLLITVSEAPVSNICVTEAVANSFSPCKDPIRPENLTATNTTEGSYCQAKGMVSVMSSAGLMQLKIFISFLALFHVIYCILTMCLGLAKMKRWKAWEEETESIEYLVAHDPRRFQYAHETSFGQRHLRTWSHHTILLWPVCFVRQFTGSATKADYFTLRNGFIVANVAAGSHFNFHNFLVRAFDDDFEQIVRIRFWIWILFMLFLFLTAKVIYTYYWLPFIPLLLALMVGTKLQVVITKMCVESSKNSAVVRGTFLVNPSDKFFWFSKPKFALYLLQIILIQNSFQLAFFTWTWYEYGLDSCFNRDKKDLIIRISTGVGVQLLCGYVTLPIYAIVTQMGSDMKKTVFTESVTEALNNWLNKARKNLSNNRSSSIAIMDFELSDTANNRVFHDQTSSLPNQSMVTPTASTSSAEITEENNTSKAIINTGTYDEGEISLRSNWKMRKSKRTKQEICTIIEENHVPTVERESDN